MIGGGNVRRRRGTVRQKLIGTGMFLRRPGGDRCSRSPTNVTASLQRSFATPVWLYFRFTLNLRDVEDLLAERGIEVSYETVRCWTRKFGRQFARNLRRYRFPPTATWHLDEMVVTIAGERMFLWRAVDSQGEVLDMLVQRRRTKAAALRLLRKLLRRQGIRPEAIVTDGLSSRRGGQGAGSGTPAPIRTAAR